MTPTTALRLTTALALSLASPALAQTTTKNEPQAMPGPIVLSPVILRSSGEALVFSQPGAVDYVDAETIGRYRGQSAADLFRGTPGVMSGEARNGGGAIDVNIRGLQGMGRVDVTVDGTSNNQTIDQGYQGLSNRSYVDPDFIAGIDISKGADLSSAGIAGAVAMRSIDASDIITPGKRWGLRIKGGLGTNTNTPVDNQKGGLILQRNPDRPPELIAAPDGMDRPALLDPTATNGSIAAAWQHGGWTALVAVAHRRQGNYFAGERNADERTTLDILPPDILAPGWMPWNTGKTVFRPGEEVLNTSSETLSGLAKLGYDFGNGHSVKLTYNSYKSEAGDVFASLGTRTENFVTQMPWRFGVDLQMATLEHRYQPGEAGLVDLTTRLWGSKLKTWTPERYPPVGPPQPGTRPLDFRTGDGNTRWGLDVENVSRVDLAGKPLHLTSGAFYRSERQRPVVRARDLLGNTLDSGADAERTTWGAFTEAEWEATTALTLRGGLRGEFYRTRDYASADIPDQPEWGRDYGQDIKGAVRSWTLGGTYRFNPAVEVYATYTDRTRAPDLMRVSSIWVTAPTDLAPERLRGIEVGTNITRHDLIRDGDDLAVKLGYFNNSIDDYVTREYGIFGLNLFNADKAKFEGLELKADYAIGNTIIGLAANYYLNVEFCRTAETCLQQSTYADYSTNQIPPEYSVSLDVSHELIEDKLTLGGRVSHTGKRVIGHGPVTGMGAVEFIALVDWEPYTTVDLFADYKATDNLQAELRVENLFDEFYIDPLGLVPQPGPGRTVRAGMTYRF